MGVSHSLIFNFLNKVKMSKITNRFVHFKMKASFTSRLRAGDIQESSVVFIQDANEIWTHGTYYKCDISEAEVIALINSKGYITEADIPSLTGGASATSGQYVSGVTVSGHNVTVTKAALPTNAETATKLATPRVIAIAGAISGSTTFDGSSNVSINSTLNSFDASKITSGTLNADRLPEIPISKIPAAAMERLYVVESQSAAVALKIQEGDVVQIGSGGPMYFCISESASTFATKFKVFTAGAATSVPWSGVLNKPSIPEAAVDSPTRIDGSKSAAVGTSSKYAKEDHIHSTNTRMLNLNGTSYTFHSDSSSNLPMVYAPTSTGTYGQILKSTGGVPTWSDLTVNIDKVSDITKGYGTSGDIPVGMRSFINEYRGDHLVFTPKEDILVEVSSNNGASWETKETTNAIASIFNSLNTEGFSTFTDVNTLTTDYKFRLTLTNSDRYCTITWLYLWISTNGGEYSLDVERYSEAKEWETVASDKTLSGWSGGNYISFTDTITYNCSPNTTAQQSKIRLTFNVKSVNSSYKSNIHIYRISGYGNFLWKYPNKNYLAAYGTIHTWDSNKTVIFPAAIKVPGAISTETEVTTPSLTVNGTYTGYLGNLDSIGLGSGDSFAVVSEGKLTLMTIDDSPIYFGQNEDCTITGSHFSGSAETANKVVGSLTIDGTAYNGSSNVTVNTKLLQGNNAGSIIKAGYSYSGCNSRITSISGFSYNNPDAVVASSTKITSFPSNVRKMANIANLSGTHYVYCFSYIGGYVYVNGAVYA